MNETADDDAQRELTAAGLSCDRAASMATVTTFRLGGPCRALITCQDPDSLITATAILRKRGLPYMLIGGGSNLLVSDHGLDCYVLRYVCDSPDIRIVGDRLSVTGGSILDAVTKFAAEAGLAGIVNTSGIPGTVGGAIVGNAGAFGWQVGDALEKVRLLAADGSVREASCAELGFSYRHSDLKDTGEIVLDATFLLQQGVAKELIAKRRELLDLRAGKHPNLQQDPCAGSFFRNIEPTSAAERRQASGWFLEQCNAKEMRVGGAGVYPKHANIIVNAGDDCRAQDVFDLSQKMAASVKEKFGFDLVREVRPTGQFKGLESNGKSR
ncbi:MAG: UDP-N-acetylmuramate dehydrogenase [Rhodothermales bacterium]|jgi:UDP-N-acetylmuramate dehydrogenase